MWAQTTSGETRCDHCWEESTLCLALPHPALGFPWAEVSPGSGQPREGPRVRLDPSWESVGAGAAAFLWLPLPPPPLWLETAINYAA